MPFVLKLLKLAIFCMQSMPQNRPFMKHVCDKVDEENISHPKTPIFRLILLAEAAFFEGEQSDNF